MAWTEITRPKYERKFGLYASDVTDQEWQLIAPNLPLPKTTGRPRSTAMRDVVDAILYIASAGCAWRMLPNDFPLCQPYVIISTAGAMMASLK